MGSKLNTDIKVNTFILIAIIICILPCTIIANTDSKCKLNNLVEQWKGKYPVQGSKNIIDAPEIRGAVSKVLGTKYSGRLKRLDAEPYYLMVPVKYIYGCLVAEYVSNPHINEELDGIVIVIDVSRCALHASLLQAGASVLWKHSGDTIMPPEIIKMYSSVSRINQ